MMRDPTPAGHPTDAQCNLCGAGMHAASAGICPGCASTAPQRVLRSVFQALPHGALAWRTLAPAPGMQGLEARWFGGRAALADMAVAAPPHSAGLAGLAALAALGDAFEAMPARGVLCALLDATPDASAALQAATAQLALHCLPCSVIAIDVGDPGSAARLCAILLLRDSADAACWLPWLQAWHGPSAVAAGTVGDPFGPLRAELARWDAAQRACSFWWRDDDLVADSPALRRLAGLSQRHGAAVLVAVIPAQADTALAQATASGMPTLAFCQHGWGHINHAPPGQPNSEFGAARDPAEAEADLVRGRERMRELFGARCMPLMVPPWNKLAPALAARLPALGIAGISQYPSEPPAPVDGLLRVDTHLDIVDWRSGGGVCAPQALVERLVRFLQMRRDGALDEPIGVLSHHRVMLDGSWRFLDRLLAVTAEFSCVRWLHPHEVFEGASAMMENEAPCAA